MKWMSSKQDSLSQSRIRIAEIICVVTSLLCVTFFGTKYLLFPLLFPSYTTTQHYLTNETIKDYVVEGPILDRNGNVIIGSAGPGLKAEASYPQNYSYAYLLGYYSVSKEKENKYGLRGNLVNYSRFFLDQNNQGAAATLTTDTNLQNFAYQNLLAGNEGSVTVIDNKTGAILCLASNSLADYNVNDVNSLLSSSVSGAQYRRGTYENDPPGSTFKIITAAAALEKMDAENIDDTWLNFTDTGSYLPAGSDWTITNYENKVYGDIGLEAAMNDSVNCYFADLGIKVGADQLLNTARKFKIGSTIEIPYLTTLQSSIDIKENDNGILAQTAYGQGTTQITPVHLALIAQSIANNGNMMAPYIVSRIQSGKLPLYRHIDHKLSTTVSEETAEQLKIILHSTAEKYGLNESTYGMVYAKTGTAECANDRIHTYIVGFTKDASFCISMNNRSHSYLLYPLAQQLVQQINSFYNS